MPFVKGTFSTVQDYLGFDLIRTQHNPCKKNKTLGLVCGWVLPLTHQTSGRLPVQSFSLL